MTRQTVVDYGLWEKGVIWSFEMAAGGDELMFYAQDIRRLGDSYKAYILCGVPEGRILRQTELKLRDGEDITRYANRVSDKLWAVTSRRMDERKTELEERLSMFCAGLWDYWMGNDSGAWVDGDAEPSSPLWAVPGFVLAGSTGIHFGNAKAGKSTIDRLIAMSLQYGVDTLFPTIKMGPTIWVNAEEPTPEHTRQLGNVNAALGLPRTSPIYTIHARGLTVADLAPRLERAIADTDAEHVFVDSLSRLAAGMSLNENATATGMVDSIAGLGTSVTWIGHTGQTNQHRLAGSKHFDNAARLTTRIQGRISMASHHPELTRGVKVTVTNANGAAPVDPQYLTLEYHQQYGLVSVRRSDEYEWPMLHCQEQMKTRECGRQTWDGYDRFDGVRCTMHSSSAVES